MKKVDPGQYLLGIDNGGTVSKVGLFTLDGQEVAVASCKTEMLSPKPGYTERNMENMWQATAEAIRQALTISNINSKDIVAIACTGHGNGLYLVDNQGQPVRNGIGSTDNRARKYIDRWLEQGVNKAVRPKTMQSIWQAQPNVLLAWIRDHEPEVLKRTRWALMCKDYIRYRLTGEIFAELTDMSGTSLMSVRDRDYDMEVLEAFGIAEMRDILPPIKRTEDICGYITFEAADETGLTKGTPVAGGMFDIDACGLACGMINENQLCMVAGTWGNNQYISKTPVVDEDVFMTSCYSIPDYYLMLEGSATSASNLEWFVTQFFESETRLAEQQGKSVYDICNNLVETTEPQDTNIIFLPFLFGSNAEPDAKSCFVGLDGWHTRAQVLRAIYEGVVFGHRVHVDRLMKFRDMPDAIRFSGGAARSEVWVQIFADCFQVPVEIPTGTELGTLGAAIAASVATGLYTNYNEAVETMIRFSRIQEPDPSKKEIYDKKYALYQEVVTTLGPVWKDLLRF